MDTVQTDATATTETSAPVADAPAAAPAPAESDVEAFARGVSEASADAPAPAATDDAQAPAAAPAADTAAAPAADEDLSDEDRAKAEIDAEVASLGLKEKSAARFRELAARPTQQAFDEIAAKAATADEWQSTVAATGASPQQFGAVMGYLSAINSGDPKRMTQVFDGLMQEVKWLGQRIGREVPGLNDPLEQHRDLAKEVADGDLPRARALEIAQQREAAARNSELTQRQRAEQQQRQQQEQANSQALTDLQTVGARLRAADPSFAEKMTYLQPTLQIIQQTMHPTQWAAAAEQAYRALPAITVAPAPAPRPTVGAMPLRPTGTATAQVRQPKNDFEAFSMGVASVR